MKNLKKKKFERPRYLEKFKNFSDSSNKDVSASTANIDWDVFSCCRSSVGGTDPPCIISHEFVNRTITTRSINFPIILASVPESSPLVFVQTHFPPISEGFVPFDYFDLHL